MYYRLAGALAGQTATQIIFFAFCSLDLQNLKCSHKEVLDEIDTF